jgi:hypothetical protein
MSDLEMDSGERGNPFSSSDEAFFQAGVHSEREPTSERPVTLDADEPTGDAAPILSVRDARRARLLRAVKSTVAGLSLLAVVGLARYALRPEIAEVRRATPAAVATGTPFEQPGNPVNDEAPTALVASLGHADDDAYLWFTPTTREPPAPPVLFGPEPASWCSDPPPSSAEPPAEIARDTKPTTRTAPASKQAKAKSLSQAPARPTAKPAHRRAKVAPMNKSALLKAIRAS